MRPASVIAAIRTRLVIPGMLAALAALATPVQAAPEPLTAAAGVSGAAAAGTAAAPAQNAPAPTPPATSAPVATAHVTYVTGSSVYLDAGRDNGLQVGDTVEVVRNGAVIARLTVSYLSGNRADCTVAASTQTVAVGDLARYTPRPGAVSPGSGTGTGAAPQGPTGGTTRTGAERSKSGQFHGRVGARYMMVKDRDRSDLGYSQPGLELRLDATGLGPVDAYADVRARRTYRKLPTGNETDSFNGVYRLAVAYHPGDPRQSIVFGRQFAPSLAVVSLFDGLSYEYNAGRWSAGGIYGAQPNPDLTVSSDIREYGGYWQYRGVSGNSRSYEITTGAIASYDQGNLNRQFAFLQGRYRGPRLNGFAVTEIDYNSGWKVSEGGQSTIDPTSVFASLRYKAGENVDLYGGYDNRRNVLLWRDRVTPETEFDDSHRQGGWGGISFRMGRHAEAAADLRRSTGGPNGTADGYSVRVGLDRLTSADLEFNLRGTHYSNDLSDGWLYSLGSGFDAGSRTHVELAVGHLDETSNVESPLDRTSDWFDLDVDVMIARRWYLLMSGERYSGDGENNDQLYAVVSFRF
jgi:hypothetical protein